MYPGHLVDDKGNVVVICPHTKHLFDTLPEVKLPYSRSHCVKINKVGLFMVDGMFVFSSSCAIFDYLLQAVIMRFRHMTVAPTETTCLGVLASTALGNLEQTAEFAGNAVLL